MLVNRINFNLLYSKGKSVYYIYMIKQRCDAFYLIIDKFL